MAQKKKTSKKYYDLDSHVDEGVSIFKIIGTIIGVVLAFAAIYGLTILVINKGEKRPEAAEASISYEKILAGTSLSQSEDEYYVLFFNSEEDDELYEAMTEYRSAKDNTVYYVNLKEGLNKYVISEMVNVNVKSASDLRVKNPTVIKVKKGKIVDSRVGKNQILDYFK